MIIPYKFLLSDNLDYYTDFIDLLSQSFTSIHKYTDIRNFLSRIQTLAADKSSSGNGLFILFVDYSSYNSISGSLNKILNSGNYILVVFHSHDFTAEPLFVDIFEQININSPRFDINRFMGRLNAEINHSTSFLSLQNEVREFYKIGKSLSSEKDTVKLLEMIIDSSMRMTSSDGGTIYLVIDRETGNWSSVKNNQYKDRLLKFAISRNTSMDINLQTSTSPITKNSIFGRTILNGISTRIDDAYNIPPTLNCEHNRNFDLLTGYKTVSVLSIPLKDHEDNIMGVIQLINKKKNRDEKIDYSNSHYKDSIIPYEFKDEMIMESLAGQAAVALENNLLYREMHELLELYKSQNRELECLSTKILKAHEEERKRIAREIHDGPAQSVANLCLKLELCKKYFEIKSFDKVESEMEELNKNIRASVKEIRSIIYNLKPSYLEDGLFKALENLLRIFMENSGIEPVFNTNGSDSVIEYYLASTIYRIVQESLSNILKYAEARNVNIDLDIDSKGLTLIIVDDGKGFDPSFIYEKKPHRLDGGFGIEGMIERVEIVKGKVDIRSAPGRGTKIIIRIPLSRITDSGAF